MVRRRTLLFLVGVKGHGGHGGQTLKTVLRRYFELGNLDKVHTWHGDVLWSEKDPYQFWWRSMVMGGHGWCNFEILVIVIP